MFVLVISGFARMEVHGVLNETLQSLYRCCVTFI